MKIIKRYCADLITYAYFQCTGKWSNGYNAYSRVTKDEKVIEEGCYYQQRTSEGLKMFHI